MKRQTGNGANEELEVTGGGPGGGTVTQGPAGISPWLVNVKKSVVPGIEIPGWDFMNRTVSSATETYIFRTGGSVGAIVATVTVVYTDATLATILNVTRV